MPGRPPPTSQLDWLSSTTAMIVLLWSRATRDLLRSFGWGIAALHRLHAATKLPRPRRPPHSVYRSRSCERSLGCGDERYRTDKLDGVIKHRSSRETTMAGRGASLDGRPFLGGTDRRYGAGGEEWQLR